jgi:predicted GNAT superfamily acetyltransferase
MEWTFDPLEIKNSYFNLERLGAIARRYNVNQYGITNSPLQGFLPTDRLVAEWWMTSQRVKDMLATGHHSAICVEDRVNVPLEIYAWKADSADRARAMDVQTRNRELLQAAFARGLSCLGYERDAEGNGCFLLGRWAEDWSYTPNS